MHWTQVYDPFGRWWLSTLVATFPILVLFGLLVGAKVKPHWCAIAGATTAATVAVVFFKLSGFDRNVVEKNRGEDDPGARLAFVALPEPEAAAERLRARGVLVNVPDRPELCDFIVPSVLDRKPVLIAIGTGGASAGLAKALRLRLEVLLPAISTARRAAKATAPAMIRSGSAP